MLRLKKKGKCCNPNSMPSLYTQRRYTFIWYRYKSALKSTSRFYNVQRPLPMFQAVRCLQNGHQDSLGGPDQLGAFQLLLQGGQVSIFVPTCKVDYKICSITRIKKSGSLYILQACRMRSQFFLIFFSNLQGEANGRGVDFDIYQGTRPQDLDLSIRRHVHREQLIIGTSNAVLPASNAALKMLSI